MALPTRVEAQELLEKYVQDNYQRFHVAHLIQFFGEGIGEE